MHKLLIESSQDFPLGSNSYLVRSRKLQLSNSKFNVKLPNLKLFKITMIACLLAIFFIVSVKAQKPAPERPAQRLIAITFDDLPAAGRSRNYNAEAIKEMTRKLLETFTAHNIPVVGFVNEKGLYQKTGEVDARIAILQMWLDAGQELGNHTFSHPSFNKTSLAAYEEDVIRGETVTKMLLEKKAMKLRYFRYPFFFTGPTLETKRAFEMFLSQRGYINAPATIDNQDYLFADVYAKAKEKGDQATMKRVADAYVSYMEQMMKFYEELSVDLFGREIPQVFYIHDSPLNADHFEDLARMLKKRGYNFVSLDRVLQDEAYRHPDNYAGTKGTSWLQRWLMTEGKEFRTEPDVPEFIKRLDKAN